MLTVPNYANNQLSTESMVGGRLLIQQQIPQSQLPSDASVHANQVGAAEINFLKLFFSINLFKILAHR